MSSDDLEQMKVLNLAVVGAFAGGVAGALMGASMVLTVDGYIQRKLRHRFMASMSPVLNALQTSG